MKKIEVEKVEASSKKIYEIAFQLYLNQLSLESMLSAIERNERNIKMKKIPRTFFESTDAILKKESAKLIKKINGLVKESLDALSIINAQIPIKKVKKSESEKS